MSSFRHHLRCLVKTCVLSLMALLDIISTLAWEGAIATWTMALSQETPGLATAPRGHSVLVTMMGVVQLNLRLEMTGLFAIKTITSSKVYQSRCFAACVFPFNMLPLLN